MQQYLQRLAAALLAGAVAIPAAAQLPATLRVCADPDNWPLSRRDGSGFEDQIARVLAEDLKLPLEVHWVPLQGGVVKATLAAGVCDVLVGVPAGFPRTATTRPYYRSTFVWVQPATQPALESFADPRLSSMRVAVPRIRRDDTATPPALALRESVPGATLEGFPAEEGKLPHRLIHAVADGSVAAALIWGPQAGWYVKQQSLQLRAHPVKPPSRFAQLPIQVAIAVGVRPQDRELLGALEAALQRSRARIDAILQAFGVPRLTQDGSSPPAGR